MRARAALVHLELAFQSGIKVAANDLYGVHKWLSNLYGVKYVNAVKLKSIARP